MNINDWLSQTIATFKTSGVISASRLDAELLLADALKVDRSWLHSHSDVELQKLLDPPAIKLLNENVSKRSDHIPLAYIRGFKEFYGRNFTVTPDTLTPRPETEDMIDSLLKLLKSSDVLSDDSIESGLMSHDSRLTIADVGTGSGCIIITVALELQKSKIFDEFSQLTFLGLDISEPALEVAEKNAQKLKADISFKKFDLMSNNILNFAINDPLIILANLPYVPADYPINSDATHEPKIALFGGSDGLDFYTGLFEQLRSSTESVFAITESLEFQHPDLQKIAEANGFMLISSIGLTQTFKLAKE